MPETCGHDKYGDADMSGCVDGEYYTPCDHPQCTGMCDSIGPCYCDGCPSPNCCRIPKPNPLEEPK